MHPVLPFERRRGLWAPLLLLALLGAPARAERLETSAGPLAVQPMVTGLTEPWAFGFLPQTPGGAGQALLISERGGTLWWVALADGTRQPVAGVPGVVERGQGGLLDLLVPRDFAQNGLIYLTYSAESPGGAVTALDRAQLVIGPEGPQLQGLTRLWQMGEAHGGGNHFGARLAEAADGAIYLSTGDRGQGEPAQEPGNGIGKILRLDPASGALTEISRGHRNPQGLAFDAAGRLWASEHGARGGDEINLIREGANYGWPRVAFGRNYNGTRIGTGTQAAGMTAPEHYWDPSIAPSGHVVLSAQNLVPQWAGHHLVGSLKFDMIARLDPGADWAEERISGPETGRVRDIDEGPDGAIWFLSVHRGALYRLAPEGL